MEGGRRVVSEGGRSVSGPLPYLLGTLLFASPFPQLYESTYCHHRK